MKFFLLAGVAAATLMAQAAEANTFSYTGSIVQWIVPTNGTFRITASGAQGGSNGYGAAGGRGVTISGLFGLRAGQQIAVAVGGSGGSGAGLAGGGGGGSFVLRGGSALLIAGGGGGAGQYTDSFGRDATTGPDGVSTIIFPGGTAGHGGGNGGPSFYAISGAGLLSGPVGTVFGGGVAQSLPTLAGGTGGEGGGFGGFGGGGGAFGASAGGGGGFSGGAGALTGDSLGGGGGGSFNAGSDPRSLGFNTGDGAVSIEAVPEPSVWSMLISGFGLVGFAMRRRVRAVLRAG